MVSSVLVIDNDVAMSEILKAILEPKAFEVLTAHEVKEGIAEISRRAGRTEPCPPSPKTIARKLPQRAHHRR